MTRFPTLVAWARIHATSPALAVMTVVTVVTMLFPDARVPGVGFIQFSTPISIQLLLPAFAGLAAAIACDNTARLPLPDPIRAIASRAAWALGWTTLAVAAANIGQLFGTATDWRPVTRNVLIEAALALACVSLRYPTVAWLPVLVFTTGSMVFGEKSQGGYYWWAVILEDEYTATQEILVGSMFGLAMLLYVLIPTIGRREFR